MSDRTPGDPPGHPQEDRPEDRHGAAQGGPLGDPPDQPYDPGGNTEMFQAFASRQERELDRPRPVGVAFRLWTLLIGLVVFAGLVWLLFRG